MVTPVNVNLVQTGASPNRESATEHPTHKPQLKMRIQAYPTTSARPWLPGAAALAMTVGTALAQISASDPTLRLWLKADTLTGANVPVWTDSSQHGLIFASPTPLPPSDTGDDLLDRHTPLLSDFENNGVTFKAVTFRQGYDPISPDPTVGHWADRLWQTNKLDDTDPTLINSSSDMTLILVYRNLALNQSLGSHQTIFAKRGPSSCPIWLGLDGTQPCHEYLTYAGSIVFPSGQPIPTTPEWGIVIEELKADGTITWTEYYASLGGWHSKTLTGMPRNDAVAGVPMTIASHAQRAGASDANPYGNGFYERCAGDIAEFALYNRSLTGTEMAAIQQSLLAKYFLKPGPPVVTVQPQSQTVNQFEPVTFYVTADGTPPFTYQWLKGGSPVSGATTVTYTIPNATPGDAGFYSVTVSNSVGKTNSEAAYLTVIPDTIAPTIASALLDYTNHSLVLVTFSELVDLTTATNTAHYTLNNSVAVNEIIPIPQTASPTWSNFVLSVVLSTTPITDPTRLTVNGVQDRAGRPAANAQAYIPMPGDPGTPPAANRLLWLAADTGVLWDAIGVYEWDDQAGAANLHAAIPNQFGNPQISQAVFPNAVHPVVTFNGSPMPVDNQPDFNLQTFSVYLVGAVDTSKSSRNWLGNWEGWTLGTSDGNLGAIKWVTHTSAGDFSMETGAGALTNMVPAYIVGTFSNPGSKTLYLNGQLVASQTDTAPIVYTTARGLALGALFDDAPTQVLVGNIAETLIYSSVSSAQDAAVQEYITKKYFTPSGVAPVALNIQKQGGTLTLTWDGQGWKLMAADTLTGTWAEVSGASSPFSVTPAGSGKFYRLQQ